MKYYLIALSLFAFVVPMKAHAHCQIPCGIYDDHARVHSMYESTETIRKAVKQIQTLSKKSDPQSRNQFVRWITAKEKHASDIIKIVAEYFLTQKIKPAASSNPSAYQAYLVKLARHHAVMRAAIKTKQKVDIKAVDALKQAIDGIASYWPHKAKTKSSARKLRVLFVLTNHRKLGKTGKSTGFYFSEFTHVYHVLTKAGVQVDLASPKGGNAPIDGTQNLDAMSQKLWKDKALRTRLQTTQPLARVTASHYDAIYFPGGHGTMWDFPNNPTIASMIRSIYEKGGVVAAVCHGPAALVGVKLSNGEYLVKGKKISAFTDSEEKAVKLEEVVPFLLASKLKDQGAQLKQAKDFKPVIAVDGRLITGQNPASATPLAHALLKAIRK